MSYVPLKVPGLHAYPTGFGQVAPQQEAPYVQHPSTAADEAHGNYWAGYEYGYTQGYEFRLIHKASPNRPADNSQAVQHSLLYLLEQLKQAGFVQAYINGFVAGYNDGANGAPNKALPGPIYAQPPPHYGMPR